MSGAGEAYMLGFSETLQLRLMVILKQTMAADTQAQNVGASVNFILALVKNPNAVRCSTQ
jgi:hypothetical protein